MSKAKAKQPKRVKGWVVATTCAEYEELLALRARVAELEAQVQVMTGIREDRDEAVAALREYAHDPMMSDAARAVLAKYPEGK